VANSWSSTGLKAGAISTDEPNSNISTNETGALGIAAMVWA